MKTERITRNRDIDPCPAMIAKKINGYVYSRGNHPPSDKIIVVGPADLPELARVTGPSHDASRDDGRQNASQYRTEPRRATGCP